MNVEACDIIMFLVLSKIIAEEKAAERQNKGAGTKPTGAG